MNDFVCVKSRKENNPSIFEGLEYFGSQTGKKQKGSGKPANYVRVTSVKPNSCVSVRELTSRCDFVNEFI